MQKSYFFTVLMNEHDWLRSFDFFIQQDSKKKIIVVLSPSRLKLSDYFLYSVVLLPVLLFPILYSYSDKKLLLKKKKIFLKTITKTKQVEYCELFETRSFGEESLKFFQKQGDYSHSRGDAENWTKMGRSPGRMERDSRSVK